MMRLKKKMIQKFKKKIVKTGNSWGVVIPDFLIKAFNICPGTAYKFTIDVKEDKKKNERKHKHEHKPQ